MPEHPYLPHAAPRWRSLLVDLYLTVRASTLGFTWLLPLVGAASVAPAWSAAQTAWLLAIALAFHVFAYMLNDVVDLRVDRSEPLRADSPLVRGTLGRHAALLVALLEVPLAFGLARAAGAGPAAFVWLALAFMAMAVYDVAGKRCPWPPLTDTVQATGWCALLLFGAALANPATSAPGAATWWLVAYVFVCVLLVNGVHGSLRDLANDERSGARTTALWFGARAVGPAVATNKNAGAVRVPPALVMYALALQVALVACALGAWHTLDYGSRAGSARAFGLVIAVLGAGVLSLMAAHNRVADRRAFINAGAWNIVATLLVLPALVLPLPPLSAAGGTVLLLAFALPVLAMWAYNGSHWRLKEPTP